MTKVNVFEELKLHYERQLNTPFPYEDTSRMKVDFRKEFTVHSACEDLNADFDDYCMVIAGTISYILNNNVDSLPRAQKDFLNKGFFEHFPQYRFLEPSLHNYSQFNDGFTSYERARNLILDYLHL